MDNLFSIKQWKAVTVDFAKFLDIRNKGVSEKTKKQYLSDLNFYMKNYILDHVEIGDYKDIFAKYKVMNFLEIRKGATARAAITNLLNFYYDHERLDSSSYLAIKKFIREYDPGEGEEIDFLLNDDISFIFSDDVKYRFPDRDQEATFVAPLIWALSYYCLFEQNHIYKLVMSDVDIKNKRIRNIRSNEDNLINEWVELNEVTLKLIKNYLKYKKFSNQLDSFIMIAGKQANNASVNKMLSILNGRMENRNRLSTSVNLQKIVRTKILFDLEESQGSKLMNFVRIIGIEKNTQLDNAIRQYLLKANSMKANGIS